MPVVLMRVAGCDLDPLGGQILVLFGPGAEQPLGVSLAAGWEGRPGSQW